MPWRAAAAAARLGCGDRPGAERLAAAEHAAAETWGTRSARGNGLLALALAADGDRARAARAEAARLLAEDPPPNGPRPAAHTASGSSSARPSRAPPLRGPTLRKHPRRTAAPRPAGG
ncbi:hypothetical protein [Streptomyces sp. Ac-502]|uniref:hypothetical protein n=1 Tax=Streptomyces sp. Ac-502 TaxID=3342801 RepID=UPI003862A957